MGIKAVNNDIFVYDRDEVFSAIDGNAYKLVYGFEDMLDKPPAAQLSWLRKNGKKLVKYIFSICEIMRDSQKETERIMSKTADKSRKRWSKEEEEALIEMASNGSSINELMVQFGRSASAISSKISALVGIGRISQKVAGKFIGFIDGANIEGYIEGTVKKVS